MAGKPGRRGHNEGSIYQRASDGKWVGAVDLGWESGKRRRKVVYGKDRAEVSRKISQLLNQHQRGLPIQTSSKTLAAFLDEWLEQVVKPTRSPSTYLAYNSVVRNHLQPLGKHKLDKLTQQQVQSLLNATLAGGTSPTTVTLIRSTLRAALNQAMKWDLVGRNVVSLTVPPKSERFEGYALSPDEVRRVVTVTRGQDLEALYAIATSVGLRLSELMGLRWQDIDRTTGTLSVRHQLQDINGKPSFVELKTKSSRRVITLPPPVLVTVRKHYATQIQQRLLAGGSWVDQDLMFCSSTGIPLSDNAVRADWSRVKAEAGIPEHVRFHDLRHSALTILASRGTPVRTLMGIAGHSNLATTMQIYAHLDADNVRTSIDMMSDLYDDLDDADKVSS